MIAATIVANNYLAYARVLAESFREHHPDVPFVVLVIDGQPGDADASEPFETLYPAQLGLPIDEWHQMAAIYSPMELATAIKPELLRHLLQRPASEGGGRTAAALYLDPDIRIYAPFGEVFETAARAGVALTPHVLHPLPRDGLLPAESDLGHSGIFNLGFICVGQDAVGFLDWWHERLRHDAVVDLANAHFTDQRWVDWVPALFGCQIIRDPGYNVAYWNAHERNLTADPDGVFRADGEPLRFFHFSGYDPRVPWQLSKHAAAHPRVTLANEPAIALLCADYAHELEAADYLEVRETAYGLDGAPNGLRLTGPVRSAYRAALKQSHLSGTPLPPTPFDDDGGDAFAEWLTTAIIGPARLEIGPWAYQIWENRPDLQAAFPDLGGPNAFRYRGWLDTDPGAIAERERVRFPVRARPPRSEMGVERSIAQSSWNIVGYFSAELGVGEAARRMNQAFEASGTLTHLVSVKATASRAGHVLRNAPDDELLYDNSLYCVNADQLWRSVAATSGPEAQERLHHRPGRRIGLWFWELSTFQGYERGTTFDLLDEVWCASQFVADAVRPASPIPVRVVTLPVTAPSAPMPFTRAQLGLPDGFVFLFSFDFNSVMERKNPLGLIEAYEAAFGPEDGAHLVIKSINGGRHADQLARLTHTARLRPDIHIIDGYVSSQRTQALIEQSDCLVSLHRSEGFGLNLAAAMAAGRPVIATGYSGNMQFMSEDSALLVPYDLTEVGEGHYPYPPDAVWAEPDLEAAAAHLRRVFDDRALAESVGQRGRDHVLATQGLDVAARDIARLLGLPGFSRAQDLPAGYSPAHA